MSILDVIERARKEPPFADPQSLFPEKRYVCTVFESVPWLRADVERNLGLELPNELAELWNACGGLILYEDNLHHQWGLVIPGPLDANLYRLNHEYREDKPDRAEPGDLIFGRFWGDRELPLIRCDKNAPHYGSVEIVSEMGPRDEWYFGAPSLEEFLMCYMHERGEKFWEDYFEAWLADQATHDLALKNQQN